MRGPGVGQRAMTQPLAVFVALVLLPAAISQQQEGGEDASSPIRFVNSPEAFFSALSQQEVEYIGLKGDINLTAAATERYDLPLVIAASRSVTIAPVEGLRLKLDLGGILQLLWLESGSQLTLEHLEITGIPSLWDGEQAGLPTQLQGWALMWPTADGADGHEITFTDLIMTKEKKGCTRETVQAAAEAYQRLLGPKYNVTANNLTFSETGKVTIPSVFVDAKTGEEVGEAVYTFENITVTCVEEGAWPGHPLPPGSAAVVPRPGQDNIPPNNSSAGNSSSSSSSSSGGSSGTAAWVYALVGTVAGLAVIAAAAALLLLRRAKRRRRAVASGILEGSGSGSGGKRGMPLSGPLLGGPLSALVVMEAGGEAPLVPGQEQQQQQQQRLGGREGGGGQASGSGSSGQGVGLLGQGQDSVTLGASSLWSTRVGPIAGLELGEIIGQGSFGKVYKGRWKGAVVAVKVVGQHVSGQEASRLAREPLLSLTLSHPCIITTYKLAVMCVQPDQTPPAHGGSGITTHDDITSSSAGSGLPCLQGQQASGAGLSGRAGSRRNGGTKPGGSTAGSGAGSVPGSRGGREARHSSSSSSSVGGSGAGADKGQAPAGAAAARVGARLSAGSGGQSTAAGLTGGVGSLGSTALGSGGAEVLWYQDSMLPGIYETVMVMEFADRGSLTHAMLGGRFLNPTTKELDLVMVLLSLLEVAQGMEYIHDLNLVHGDLKGRNVLLKSSRSDRRGFTCKIADFGLSRVLAHEQTHVDTSSYGTASHAAPELLGEGKASRASDVYAFGILMWEMAACEEAHSDMSTFQLIATMSRQPGFRPPMPPHCPPRLAALIQCCWQEDPQARPSFVQVIEELRGMLQGLRKAADARGGASKRSTEARLGESSTPRETPPGTN